MKRFWLLLCALCLIGAQAVQGQKIPFKWEEKPINGVSKAWLRLLDFYAPRAFPNNNLPLNLWLNARLHAQGMEITYPEPVNGIGIQGLDGWEFMGPDTTSFGWLARVNAIVVDRTNANNLYVGVAKGGVWKSTDTGTTWTNLTDNLIQYVGCLTQDPVNANTLYLGTGEEYGAANTLGGVGIYKSTDGGATWTLKGNSTFAGQRINEIVIDPSNTNKWIVSSDWGVYVTTDGGTSFSQKLGGLMSALRKHPTNHSIFYAAIGTTWHDGSNGIYKSTDGANTWTKLGGGLPGGSSLGRIELDIAKSNPNVLYATTGDSTLSAIFKTTDAGATWTSMPRPSEPFGNAWYDLVIRVDPTNPSIVYVGNALLYKSTDGGTSWADITSNHPDMHAIEFHPTTPTTVYMGQDSGLYVSTNGGTNWTHKNAGRGTMEYYAFDVHPTDPNKLAAGAQDNATHLRTSGNSFGIVIGGDGFWTAYKKNDPNIMLGESQYGNIARSTDGGSNWAAAFTVPGGGWSTPIINDPTNPNNFYTGGQAIWRSSSSGAGGSWVDISGALAGTGWDAFRRLAVAPSNGNVFYAGAGNGLFVVSTNATAGAPTWVNRSAGLPAASIGAIAVHPTTASTVYVGLMGWGISHVWKSTNNGAAWTNYSGNLPDTPVSGLVVNPVNHAQLLAATDAGVFLTSDGTTWTRYGEGLPTTPCTHLVGNATTGYLTVSTYGRGMWRIPLPGGNPAPTITSLNPNTKPAGSAAFTLTVTGSNFLNTSKVRWNGADRTTTYGSSTSLTASITAADVQNVGTVDVTVFNPAPGGGTSNPVQFPITGNNTLPVAGLAGAALQFNGTNQGVTRASLTGLATGNTPHTIEAWVKMNALPANRAWPLLLGTPGTGSHHWLINSAGQIQFGVWSGGQVSGTTLPVGTWTHLASTFNGTTYRVYVNGNQVGAVAATFNLTSTALAIGLLQGVENGFNGQVDEVKLWNHARTAGQISFDKSLSHQGNEPGLVAYYHMNEGVGSTTTDATSNANTGTLNGSPTWVASGADVNAIGAHPTVARPVTLAAFDLNANPLTYIVTSNPGKGALTGTAPNLTYTSDQSYLGADSFTYKANDGTGDSNTATVNINFGMPSVTFAGTTVGGPFYNRPDDGAPPTTVSGFATSVRHRVMLVTVPTSGNYSFALRSKLADYDPFLTLYSGNFDPANPLTNARIANDDKYIGNFQLSGFDNVALTAGTNYLVVATGYDNNDAGDFDLVVWGPDYATISLPRSISGRVIRADSQGIAYQATFLLHPSDNSGDILRVVTVSGTGNFSLTNVPAKNYRIKVKSSNTLSRALNANTTSGDVTGLNFPNLLGGDANNDNIVALEDLGLLIQSFDADSSSPNWLNGVADFNGDGLIAVDDLSILIRNFDLEGEE